VAASLLRAAPLLAALLLAGCAERPRQGMVVDPATGVQMGAYVERNLLVDAAQFPDRRIKLRLRNASGDPAYDLDALRPRLAAAYAAKGYQVVDGDDYAALVDVNLLYSGQYGDDLRRDFGFLAAAAGGLAGAGTRGTPVAVGAGVLSGLALGAIAGAYVREDTYVVVAEFVLATPQARPPRHEKTVTFGTGAAARQQDEAFRPFAEAASTRIAVYAGGRNLPQARIAGPVRQRLAAILADVI
jgi:hypothetical protein